MVSAEPLAPLPTVRCEVRSVLQADVRMITITDTDTEPLDQASFILACFPDRGFSERASACERWRVVSLGATENATVAVNGSDLLARENSPWRFLAGSVALGRLIRLQRRHLFLDRKSVV